MTSKAQRRNKRRARSNARGVTLASDALGQLPRPLRLVLATGTRIRDALRDSGGDFATAASTARAQAIESACQIAESTSGHDAFDVLECVRLSELLHDPETYRETEHEGSVAVIELTALVLSTRGHRVGALPDSDGHRARVDAVVQDVLESARESIEAGMLATDLAALAEGGSATSIQHGALVRELNLRNVSYTHMLEDTLTALFDEPLMAAHCQAAMGVTVQEIRSVFAAIQGLTEEGWGQRFELIRDFVEFKRAETTKLRESDGAYEPTPETVEVGRALWDAVWTDPADVSTFTANQLATSISVEIGHVEQILTLFSIEMSERDPAIATEEFFDGQAPFRTLPIISDPSGASVAVHAGLLLPAIRERVEQELIKSAHWEPYQQHRGVYLEQESLALLTAHFPTATIHRSIKYFVPNPNAATPESTPDRYTKLVEGDGLLVVDDVAIIVEAKAGALSPASRTGNAARLGADLRKIVTDADGQARRMRDRIREDHGLRLQGNSWLDLQGVREIHAIAVSLEDLSGIATVTSKLVEAGFLAHAEHPWTVSLHDLRIISELVERPAELLLYLRRRTEPEVTRRFHAVDELDFFLEFYATGLYVEPDPAQKAAELPQFGEPAVANKRRFRRQPLKMITSRTDVLDAWYFYELGTRTTPAMKPSFNANAELLPLVDHVTETAQPGWLRTGTTLLEGSSAVQRSAARYSSKLAKATLADRRSHSFTAAGGTRADTSFVIVWMTIGLDETRVMAENRLRTYISAKNHQLQVAIGAGLLFDPKRPESPCFTTYDNRVSGADAELDAAVVSMRLRPIENTGNSVRMPDPNRRTRTTGRSS